jgi:predicted short-subunit dehydrogenase-like oxidoreductase (DUF2520 family)
VQLRTDAIRGPIGIAGGGKVGRALGRVLHDRGEPVVCVASRTLEHAKAAAESIGAGVEAVTYAELASRASRLLISVPDEALEEVAGMLNKDGGIALHTCGARGPDALKTMRLRGVACGTLHPLQTFPDAGSADLEGVAFAISGDDKALEWAGQIAALVHGRVLRVEAAVRPLYHAAAVMASNYVIALLAAAETLMETAGIEKRDALDALAPLVRTSVENALKLGPVQAITGPIQRGDAATVEAHRNALRSLSEPLQVLYRAGGLQALEIAKQRGLSAESAAAVETILN